MSTANTKTYRKQGGDIVVGSGGIFTCESGSIPVGVVLCKRQRCLDSEINAVAGVVILPAIPLHTYRMVSAKMIAYGGAITQLTSVDLMGDDGSAAILVSYLQAQATENTVLFDGITGATVLAAGASYVANPAGVAISLIGVGTNETTADGVDLIIEYVIEAA